MAPSRIEELRRRVQADPASIAFAQLAEEYRRSGQTDEAVRVCREGLTRHPGYLSARVTLGRALLDLGQLADARGEFQFVVAEAPENLAAVRGLAEIFQRDGNFVEALTYYRRALALARHDPEIEEIVKQLSRQEGVAAAGSSNGLTFEEAHRELLSAAERVPVAPTPPPPAPSPPRAADAPTAPFDFDRLVAALGMPAAPPQVEAVVAGTPSVVPIAADATIELGPNPFAALEAELLAHNAQSQYPPAEDPGPGRYQAVTSAFESGAPAPALESAAAVLEDTMLNDPADIELVPEVGDGTVAALGDEPVFAPGDELVFTLGDEPVPPFTFESVPEVGDESADASEAPTVMLAVPELPAEAAPAAPAVPVAAAVDEEPPVVDEPPVAGDPPIPVPVPAASAPAGDVLDDLESWLNTLHDRSAS